MRIDAACLHFESEWKAGHTPAVQEMLGDTQGDERSALLVELLRVEAHYRRQRGESPSADSYLPLFPGDEGAVLAAFSPVCDTIPYGGAALAGLPLVPGFDVLGRVGAGGMGVVYKARQHWPPRIVAVKVLRQQESGGPDARRMFLDEIGLLARMEHENIVRVYGAGEAGSVPYFSMEFVAGGNLRRHLATALPPPDAAATLVETLARAVDFAHRRGIVHRDLKPSNVLLAFAGDGAGTAAWHERPFSAKIADFGLARGEESGGDADDKVMGTPAYMAPEQARAGETGPATDVYGLGAILYECLTGRPPFPAGSVHSAIARVLGEAPAPPGESRAGIPPELEAICLKCLSKRPEERPASAHQLAEELRRFLDRGREKPPSRFLLSRPMLLLYAGLVALAVVAWLRVDRLPPFERARANIEAALATGKPFELRGDEEMPGPLRPILAGAGPPVPSTAEGCFSIETTGTALVEVAVPPAGCDEYDFSADVRHDGGGENSRTGIYFGFRQVPGPGGAGGWQGGVYTLSFDDRGKPLLPPTTRVEFRGHLFSDKPGKPLLFTGGSGDDTFIEYPRPENIGPPRPWRRVTVRLSKEGAAFSWSASANKQEALKRAPTRLLERLLASSIESYKQLDWIDLTAVPTEFTPEAGVGLYVKKGKASFRRIAITPAKPD